MQSESIINRKSKEDYFVNYLGEASWREIVLELNLETFINVWEWSETIGRLNLLNIHGSWLLRNHAKGKSHDKSEVLDIIQYSFCVAYMKWAVSGHNHSCRRKAWKECAKYFKNLEKWEAMIYFMERVRKLLRIILTIYTNFRVYPPTFIKCD